MQTDFDNDWVGWSAIRNDIQTKSTPEMHLYVWQWHDWSHHKSKTGNSRSTDQGSTVVVEGQ